MPVHDIYSKRTRQSMGPPTGPYTYDSFTRKQKVKIVHILCDLLGHSEEKAEKHYRKIHDALAREYGHFLLADADSSMDRLVRFVLEKATLPEILDVIELSIKLADRFNLNVYVQTDCRISALEAITELNARFREEGIGYQIENHRVLRIDSQYLHKETVKPALGLLRDAHFAGPEQEFQSALKHYRENSFKECLTDCLKAFESTMKTICEIRHWTYQKTDTAKTLIDICLKNGLINPILLSHVTALRTVLEAGVPTLRNKLSGHGQGSTPVSVPGHYVAYALHLTASNILFLVESEKALG